MVRTRIAVIIIVAGLSGAHCAGKDKSSNSPGACVSKCEKECPYMPDAPAGNDDYYECVEGCIDKCGGQ